jgi:hypothetical protein
MAFLKNNQIEKELFPNSEAPIAWRYAQCHTLTKIYFT